MDSVHNFDTDSGDSFCVRIENDFWQPPGWKEDRERPIHVFVAQDQSSQGHQGCPQSSDQLTLLCTFVCSGKSLSYLFVLLCYPLENFQGLFHMSLSVQPVLHFGYNSRGKVGLNLTHINSGRFICVGLQFQCSFFLFLSFVLPFSFFELFC